MVFAISFMVNVPLFFKAPDNRRKRGIKRLWIREKSDQLFDETFSGLPENSSLPLLLFL